MAYWRRNRAAEVITETMFPVSARTLHGWTDVPLVYLHGYACAEDQHWLAVARKRLKAMLARQGADDLAALQSAKRAGAGAEAARERKRQAAQKLRVKRGRSEARATT
jgi:hypothetical protein